MLCKRGISVPCSSTIEPRWGSNRAQSFDRRPRSTDPLRAAIARYRGGGNAWTHRTTHNKGVSVWHSLHRYALVAEACRGGGSRRSGHLRIQTTCASSGRCNLPGEYQNAPTAGMPQSVGLLHAIRWPERRARATKAYLCRHCHTDTLLLHGHVVRWCCFSFVIALER